MTHNKVNLSYIEYVLFFIVILFSQKFYNTGIMTLVGVILGLYVLFSSIEKIFIVFMLLIPSAENLSFIGTITIPTLMVIIFFIRVIFNKVKKGNIKVEKWMVFSIILLLYSSISIFLLNTKEQFLTTIKGLLFLIFMSSVFENYEQHNNKKYQLYVLAIRNVGIGLCLAFVAAVLINKGFSFNGRFHFGENSTINIIGIQSAIVIISLLYLFIIKATTKILDLFIIFICMIIAFLTLSKTAILMIFIGVILLLMFSILKGGSSRMFILSLLFLIVGVLFYYSSNTMQSYTDKLLVRFSADDLSNGRYDLWNQTTTKMRQNKEYFLFGAGDYKKIGATYGNMNYQHVLPAHNFLIETWVVYGTIGILLVLFQYIAFIKEKIFCLKFKGLLKYDNFISFAPLFVVCAGYYYSHHFIGRVNSLLFILSFVPIIIQKELIDVVHKEVKK